MTDEDLDARFRNATPDYPYAGYEDDGFPMPIPGWAIGAIVKVAAVVAFVGYVAWSAWP